MIITKKRHEREIEELKKNLEIDHATRIACVEARCHEDRTEFRKFMERVRLYRIRHGTPIGADGESHTYTIATQVSMELMHNALGGSTHTARMVANEIRESVYLALVALCHLDQPPIVWSEPE